MNKNFHYYAIKTLARCAGFDERKAQLIAEYSQFISDFRLSGDIITSWAHPMAIENDIAHHYEGKYKTNLITTGFGGNYNQKELCQPEIQENILAPFHYIVPSLLEKKSQKVVAATFGDEQVISKLLSDIHQYYRLRPNDALAQIGIGCMLHTFADTHAHVNLTGYFQECNNYELASYMRYGTTANSLFDQTAENINISPLLPYANLPEIGHSTSGHGADDSYCQFRFCHQSKPNTYQELYRDNYEVFTDLAEAIYGYLSSLTDVDELAENQKAGFKHYKDCMERGFLLDNYDDNKMSEGWLKICRDYDAIKDISFHYSAHDILLRQMPDYDMKEEYDGQSETKVTNEFWYFMICADAIRKGCFSMSILTSLFTSLMPTIGTIVGSLIGKNSVREGKVLYQFMTNESLEANSVRAENQFSGEFVQENGQYILFNSSKNKDDCISITFPAINQYEAETAILPGRQQLDVTQMFKDNANIDSSQFEMTGKQSGAAISSCAKGIPVGDKQMHRIGSFLDAQVDQGQVIIKSKNPSYQLNQIPLVFVHGSGDTGYRVTNIDGGNQQQVIITLPEELLPNDRVEVEVIADLTIPQIKALGKEKLLMTIDNCNLIQEVSEERIQAFENAPILNKRR